MEEENVVNERDRFVTDEVCALRMKDIQELDESVKILSEDIREFRQNDIPHLKEAMSKISLEISNRVTSLDTWKKDHEDGHGRQFKVWQIVVSVGSWLIALITLLVLLITVVK